MGIFYQLKETYMNKLANTVIITALFCTTYCLADTFTHYKTGDAFHGYSTSVTKNGKTEVHSKTSGKLLINLAEYDIHRNSLGRNKSVAVIVIPDMIALQMETDAFEKAIKEEADKGPLFILIEIDTPGGRVDLAKQMCGFITKTDYCKTVAFINGGNYGGAYSAGAAIAMACDKIYMADDTVIGAATMLMSFGDAVIDIKDVYGETLGEKARSAWRNTLASLAQQNDRPGILAKAMEDKDIEVIEVDRNGKRMFIEPANKKGQDTIVYTWSKKGSLLTLPAKEAVKCNMADGTVSSQAEVLRDMGAASSEIVINNATDKARREFKKVERKFNELKSSLDLRFKQLSLVKYRSDAIKLLNILVADVKKLQWLKKRYPDVEVDEDQLQSILNTLHAYRTTL